MVNQDQYGACYEMNEIINTLPTVILNYDVISSTGCEGVKDRLHFSAEGYRTWGKRYAERMLTLLDYSNQ